MISSRDLNDLHPKVKQLAEKFIDECHKQNIDILITSTYRDNESQNALYAIGRTIKGANPRLLKPKGNIVTNAKAGQSFHNYKLAFDFVPIVNGKPDWNNLKTFEKCGKIAESIGLEWAGRWKGFKELAHCQYTEGLTLAELQSGKSIKVV